jgi:hypothetical protein
MGPAARSFAADAPDRNPSCLVAEESGRRLARAVLTAMDKAKLDALVYPSWNNPPRLIGDLNTPMATTAIGLRRRPDFRR